MPENIQQPGYQIPLVQKHYWICQEFCFQLSTTHS